MNENTKAIEDAERIIAEYPRKELTVGCCQVARDMSVGISNIEKELYLLTKSFKECVSTSLT